MKQLLLAALFVVPILAQSEDPSGFWTTMQKAERLQDRKQALQVLEAARRQYPAREFELSQEIAFAQAQLGQYEKAMEIWRAGHASGFFYGLSLPFDSLQPLRNLPQFQALVERDRERRQQAERTATMRYEIVTPTGYSADRKYPLFLVLHAGNDSIEHARSYWWSPALRQKYLVAFIQSARPMSSKSYGWRVRDAEMREGLHKLYDEIVARYPVDTSHVLIGGMSAGAMMSLDVVIHNVLPVSGYVVNCPMVPPDFEPAMAGQMRQRGVRGAIITGEKDPALASLKESLDVFTKAGVKYSFTIIPRMGHEIPEDLPSRLDAALAEVDPAALGRTLTVTLTGNEGFLLSSGGQKVLIDALVAPHTMEYNVPSPEVRGLMEAAAAPFDGVGLVLVTHPHDDHFSAKVVAAHLSHNPAAVFISTHDAVDQVRRLAPDLESRTRAVTPDALRTSRSESVGPVGIDVMRVDHGLAGFENLAYRFRLDGISVLHMGDSANWQEYKSFDWSGPRVDVAFASVWKDSSPQNLDVLENVIKPRILVLMHYVIPGDVAEMRQVAEELRPHFERVVVFSKQMESVTFDVR